MPGQIVLQGRSLARGIAYGHAHVDEPLPSHKGANPVSGEQIELELERLERARDFVQNHIEEHVREFHAPTDEYLHQVLAAHQLILDDQPFFQGITRRIKNEALRAEAAVEQAFCDAADRLAATRDVYLKARAEDIRDVCQTILTALVRGEDGFRPVTAEEDIIFVTRHLHVSSVLRARRAGAKGFVTSSHAFASHGAILLRASGIPSVCGLDLIEDDLHEGTPLLVDGFRGEVVLYPGEEKRATISVVNRELSSTQANRPLPPLAATTADGSEIKLWANVDTPLQAEMCLDHRLEGIGLFRTEFLILVNGRAPDEEEQYAAYLDVIERIRGRPLVLRTFDIGAEKVISGLTDDTGANPSLGLRGIRRHLLRRQNELRTQLRAALRATVDVDASIMLPMVSHVGDVVETRRHLEEVKSELQREGLAFNPDMKLGVMIEVPSAALGIADILAVSDFASVGTNDLTQYLSAADRNNADVSSYLRTETSGLLVMLEWMLERARELGRADDIAICGEVASDPEVASQLVELGYRALTIAPLAANTVRAALASIRVKPQTKH